MKIFAMGKVTPSVTPEMMQPHAVAETRCAWEMYKTSVLRELYLCADGTGAIGVMECRDADEARKNLSQLPLVKAGMLSFEIVPVLPYVFFERLFAK